MSNITTLAFENTTFEIVDQNGQPWLRATDVANALGYSRSDKVGRLYSRNADEFTPSMTAVVETPTLGLSGNLVTETRIFSLRGAHLLAMFARTEKAKAFRVWLLDLIEAQARNTRPHTPAIHYDRISPAQAQDLKELVHSVVDAKVQGFAETWARLHKKFRVNSYLELPATRFDEARDYLLGKLPEAATSPALPDMNRTRAAFDAAAQAAASVQTAVFNAVLAGNDEWKFDRWLLAFIDDSVKAAPAHVWRLNQGDFIANWPKLVKDVATGECMCTSAELLDMAAACMQRLQQRGGPARLAA